MAVGEASALVFPAAKPGTDVTCEFFMHRGRLTVVVSVQSPTATTPDEDSFAWQVLTTLAGDASASVEGGRFGIRLTMHSGPGQSTAWAHMSNETREELDDAAAEDSPRDPRRAHPAARARSCSPAPRRRREPA